MRKITHSLCTSTITGNDKLKALQAKQRAKIYKKKRIKTQKALLAKEKKLAKKSKKVSKSAQKLKKKRKQLQVKRAKQQGKINKNILQNSR